jgi:putative pyoverdin transport system ATP-binding/permease protein
MEIVKFLLEISWKQMAIATIAGLVSGGGNALLISLINREVREGRWENDLLYFIAVAIFIIVTSLVSQYMLIFLSQNAVYQLRLKLSQNILASPLEHLERLRENRLIVTLTEDIHTLTHAVSSVPSMCTDFATVIGCFVFFALLSPTLFSLTLGSSVLTIMFVQTMLNKAQYLFFSSREEEDNLFKNFRAMMNGTKELKLNRAKREAFVEKDLKGSVGKLRQLNTKAMKSFAVANSFGQLSQFASMGFILFMLPLLMTIPLSMLATYVLIGTFLALPMQNLLSRIPELVRGNVSLRKIERMKLSLMSLNESETLALPVAPSCQLEFKEVVYTYQPELPPFPPEGFGGEGGHPPFPPEGFGEGSHPPFPPEGFGENGQQMLLPEGFGENGHPPFPPEGFTPGEHPPFPPEGFSENGHPPHPDGANHRQASQATKGDRRNPPPHPDGRAGGGMMMPPPRADEKGFALGPISLSLQPGELLFIIGGNGSGKSTLAKLITGLYAPESGTIELNGKPVTPDNVEWYRQHFSAVFSDFYLFDSYLGFDRDTLDSEVSNYLKELQLSHKVSVKDGVLSTTNLSQGQRKRLALLETYLENRPVYVFDEWASDQEPKFRELFYKQMLPELKRQNKIVIVITHDDRYFHIADHVIKLDYGKIEFDRVMQE